ASWRVTAIDCAGGTAAVDPDDATAAITVAAGNEVICTFVNKQRSTIRIRIYQDQDGNGRRNEEPMLAAWTTTLYDATGNWLATGVSNAWGTAEFAGLRPNVYRACVTLPAGWYNTQPGTHHPAHDNQACYEITVNPAERWTAWFGNSEMPPLITSAGQSETLVVEQIVDEEDDAGYETDVSADTVETILFVPIVTK
ncbi:MAG: hypothetical protein KDE31_13860, partial [Caldilineaceae bacterium]|nr:hypothetical protein [Caldilineaceae bacterium]